MMVQRASKNFVVTFKSGDTQPLVASSYSVDEECLIFLDEEEELAAFFDIREVADWNPKMPGSD